MCRDSRPPQLVALMTSKGGCQKKQHAVLLKTSGPKRVQGVMNRACNGSCTVLSPSSEAADSQDSRARACRDVKLKRQATTSID